MYIDKYQKDYYNYSDGKKPKSNVHENDIFKVYEYKYIIIHTTSQSKFSIAQVESFDVANGANDSKNVSSR